ncbi:MAG: tetratricopeptide repeat protein [Verrucomicrobia bacterium]|nr:tetratricopeptide repeat protein [Verrucomicrobiota bacterium]
MMPPLVPPDSLHLQAAEGWVGLGDYASANDELEQFSPASRAHPEVLQLRWRICATAKKWDVCLDIATTLTTMTPERRFGWIHRAHALDKLGRTLEAKDMLLSVVDDFESNSTLPYHLAQYCARLGQIDQAKQWLGKALLAADGLEAVNRLRKMALEDPDLEPLRKMP